MNETREKLVLTPTVRRQQSRHQAEYLFAIEEGVLRRLRGAGLGPAAILAYTAIRGALWAARDEWVTIRAQTYDAFAFPPHWWLVNVKKLAAAGFVECDQKPGRLKRFRIPERARRAAWLPE